MLSRVISGLVLAGGIIAILLFTPGWVLGAMVCIAAGLWLATRGGRARSG